MKLCPKEFEAMQMGWRKWYMQKLKRAFPGAEDMRPYIDRKDKLGKWLMGTPGFAILSAVLSGIMR